ncbi:MAG: ABC transporter ATP-binding protein [Candidatus Omnitrophota bacterium]|jgi:peptide/nickel transport system ATP-binding protein/oligopeptide transport system ATP-binding protein|nr:MAG: ABC transporter ATP-binding protein [Candidatus Omnitrophota bacterium]
MIEPLLKIEDLHTWFFTTEGVGRAVDGVDFEVRRGETFGLVGESGCGKSMTSLSILKLVPSPPGRIVSGQIRFKGNDLLPFSEKKMRQIRGNQISLIFQEPMTALNPVFTVGEQIAEMYRIHRGMNRRESFEAAVDMMEKVKIPAARKRAREYPHQLSGGMRQRIMIAMALACDPDLLIADEPTTALDVTIQAQILALLDNLKQRTNAAVILITHDLGVIAETADHVAVMYAGQIVEEAPVDQLFSNPLHPYTQGLLRSIPQWNAADRQKLHVIHGAVPTPTRFPGGCRFHPRCEQRKPLCEQQPCDIVTCGDAHSVRCFLYHNSTSTTDS